VSKTLTTWKPEDQNFWKQQGQAIAQRNLWISIPNLLFAFSVWVVWSVVSLNLDKAGFSFSKDQLFLLTALPALSGATLRIAYSFMPALVGGRNFTVISTLSLLAPALWLGFAVQDPTTSYSTFVIIALLCGFGGGNFSSSMANIGSFFPKAQKGYANGMNAGLGNLGVSVTQLLLPIVIGFSLFGALGGDPQVFIDAKTGATGQIWLQNAGFFWVPFIVLSAIAAFWGMNNLAAAKASVAEQSVIFKSSHNWIMCWLYIGTFGSFIGFSAGFALLTKTMFPEVAVMQFAFLGPLIGAAVRPIGGWISDKIGGAVVTLWTFIGMLIATASLLIFLPEIANTTLVNGKMVHNYVGGNFSGFLTVFLILFALTGIGNGSTFRMIPMIFLNLNQKRQLDQETTILKSAKESAAAIGFAGAIGAYGGFFIPQAFGKSLALTGLPQGALYGFLAFYVSCVILTWWLYARKNAPMPC
jgi:NNP family nitrate/nitrite transporter-like MFS transporter